MLGKPGEVRKTTEDERNDGKWLGKPRGGPGSNHFGQLLYRSCTCLYNKCKPINIFRQVVTWKCQKGRAEAFNFYVLLFISLVNG